MKKKNYVVLLVLMTMLMASSSLYAQKKGQSKSRYEPRKEVENPALKGITGALEYYKLIRNNQITGEIDYENFLDVRQQVEQLGASKNSTLTWRSIGPTDQGGRVRSIIFDRNDPSTMYVGAVSGGLWKTTNSGQSWFPLSDTTQNLIVSCIAQASNGIVYFGTGEGFAPSFGSIAGSTGFVGMGVFKAKNASNTEFERVTPTATTANGWNYVYELKIHPNGDIYAATNKGVKISSDGGTTWTNPLDYLGAPGSAAAHDIDFSTNGNVISLVVGRKVYISTNSGATYTNASTGGNMLPASGLSRIEVDIAPSNSNYIYACAANSIGALNNIYRSTDAGLSWTIIGPGGSPSFNLFGSNNQGFFDNVIKVHPTNPNKIYVGGIDMWTWEYQGNWEQKSLWFLSEYSPFYLHADHHAYAFHPNNPNIMYFGTDGGISKSTNGGNTFETTNRNFVTLQNYAISISKEGWIMCGTQDNGTLLMKRDGFVEGRSDPMFGGDGGFSSFSFLNNKLLFVSIYYGDVFRTPTGTPDGFGSFYDDHIASFSPFNASFVTPLVLHEKIDDYLSPDSVEYINAGEVVYTGDTIYVPSGTSGYLFPFVIPAELDSLNTNDTIKVQDIVTSKFYVGITGRVIMTRESHTFSKVPEWWTIAMVSGTVQTLSVSKCGNYLFVGTQNGNIYRVSNLSYANDMQSGSIYDLSVSNTTPNPFCVVETKKCTLSTGGRPINSIAIDPNNPERILVVLGSYGNTQYLYYSSNALSAEPTFSTKQGNLPTSPVYSAIFDITNPNTVLVGTEYGVYMTTNITAPSPSWTEENLGGIARVPVYDLKQQIYWMPGVTNYGVVYAGTHGRGVFESLNFVSVPEYGSTIINQKLLEVYPNPVEDELFVNIPEGSNATAARIFNISGKVVGQMNIDPALRTVKFDVASLPSGVYFIELIDSQNRHVGKFIKTN